MKKLVAMLPVLLFSLSLFAEKNGHNGSPQIPVDGKIYFSNQPFAGTSANSKNSFTSAEWIYARIELPASTIKEAFKMKDGKGLPFLHVEVSVLKNGEVLHYGYSKNYILVKEEFKNSNSLNFDILPEASKTSTLYSMLSDFSAGNGANSLTSIIWNAKLADGNYKVEVKVYNETTSVYGSLEDREKWPFLVGEFDLKFSQNDVERIMANSKLSSEIALENAFRLDKLPPVFSNPGKLTDPGATAAKIAAILKRDLPGRQIIKWVAETYNGPYWHIATDDWGLPKYKYFNPHIWMAYKSNGKCYVGYVTLRQNYAGGGRYSTLAVAYTTTKEDKGIDCVKVK